MEVSALHSQLKSKILADFYIFSGPEWAIQKTYINQIAKISGLTIKYIDSISGIYSKLKHPTMLSTNYIYVLRDDKEIINTEKIHPELLNGLVGKNILILLLTNPDKRTKFYHTFKDMMYEFEALKPAVLKKYIQKLVELSDSNAERLMDVCEHDYGRCLLEIDKIKRFDAENPDKAFKELLKSGTIYIPPRDAIFDFVDAVLCDDVKDSFSLYQQCLAVGEAKMVMVSVLYDNAKAVLQVQSCESKDISKTTGLTGWQIRNAKEKVGYRSNSSLINIMEQCRKVEVGIKTGKIEEEVAMDYILANIF